MKSNPGLLSSKSGRQHRARKAGALGHSTGGSRSWGEGPGPADWVGSSWRGLEGITTLKMSRAGLNGPGLGRPVLTASKVWRGIEK